MSDILALNGGVPAVTSKWPAYPVIDQDEVCAAVQVVMSGLLSDCGRGGVVGQMEDDFSGFFGTEYGLAFCSGTAAIHGALFAAGVRPGVEVLCANHNWISGITAIFHAGGTPILCDVKKNAFSIDAAEIRRKATPNTKAVIVTHLWGLPADMDPIMAVARELNLVVIEDVSHAHGARYKGRYCGAIGDIGCFSLQGSKAIVAGEGGVMITNNKRYYERAMIPGHHGGRTSWALTLEETRPFSLGGGYWTYRIAPVAAAIASAQLKKLPRLNAARQANFDRLSGRLKKSVPFISWPEIPEHSARGWYNSPALYEYPDPSVSRDRFVAALGSEGAGIGGEGYCDWSQIPMLQDMELLGQLFPVQHANGVAFKPIKAGSLPHNEEIREKMLLLPVPAVEVPDLMDQIALAVEKVAANMASLK